MTLQLLGSRRRAHSFLCACAFLAMAIGVSSCGRADSVPPEKAVTLAVWANLPAEQVALDQGIAAFKAATGITVRKEVIVDRYMDVLRSRFAARRPPDVFYLDASEAPLLIRSGVLEPLDARIDRPQDFYPRFLDALRGEDGKVYGIPKDYSTLALYLNRDLLAKAGVTPDQVPRDFEGFMAFARWLQPHLPPGSAALLYEQALDRHLSALEAYGTPVIAANGTVHLGEDAGSLSYLDAYVRGHKEGYVFSPKDDLGNDSAGAAFGSGRAAMMMEGNWVAPTLRQDYPDVHFVTREMPRVNGRPQTMAYVVGLSVSRWSKNKEGGILFAQFMTGRGMKAWAQVAGVLPTRKSLTAELNFAADPVLGPHVAGAEYATVWSRGIGLPVVSTNFGNQILGAMNGSRSVAEAMRNAERAYHQEMERQQ